jgi:hypothetical protein
MSRKSEPGGHVGSDPGAHRGDDGCRNEVWDGFGRLNRFDPFPQDLRQSAAARRFLAGQVSAIGDEVSGEPPCAVRRSLGFGVHVGVCFPIPARAQAFNSFVPIRLSTRPAGGETQCWFCPGRQWMRKPGRVFGRRSGNLAHPRDTGGESYGQRPSRCTTSAALGSERTGTRPLRLRVGAQTWQRRRVGLRAGIHTRTSTPERGRKGSSFSPPSTAQNHCRPDFPAHQCSKYYLPPAVASRVPLNRHAAPSL